MILSIIALSILILVHELGHFVAARWKGVSVAEFAIGYGPKLLRAKTIAQVSDELDTTFTRSC